MKRLLTLILLLPAILAAASPDVLAQGPLVPAAPAPPPPAAPGINPADAQRVIDLLNDPKKRAEFIATLDTVVKALPQAAPVAAPETATSPLPLIPNSLGAQLLVSGSSLLNRISDRLRDVFADVRAFPAMGGWLLMIAGDPLGQKLLLDTAWRLAVTFAVGLAAEWIAIHLLHRMPDRAKPAAVTARKATEEPDEENENNGQNRAERGAIEPPEPPRSTLLVRLHLIPGILLRLLLSLVPVVCFFLAAHLVVSTSISEVYLTRLILLAMIDAYSVSRIILCCARAVLAPTAPQWRLLPIATETATSGLRWVRWLTLVCVFGYAAAEAGLLRGRSQVTRDALLKTVGFVALVQAVMIVLRNRAGIAELIRARPGQTGPMVRWRKLLASVWHLIASLYLAGLWLVWAIDIQDGFRRLLNIFVVGMLVLAAARVLRSLLLGLLDRQIETANEIGATRHPDLIARMRVYHPLLNFLVHAAVSLAALIALTEFWGLGTMAWLMSNPLVQRMISALTTIAIALVAAVGVWEVANAWVEQHLSRLQRDSQTARSARLRTLLPMLRTALLIAILAVVAMVVLSEIGVNIAPLLAGAGVIGIAIGFGSQTLVRDVITGLFLLLENTMQVGDVVLLGGLQGVVEHLSIRTIRLRAEDGSVHVIPFSAVTTVTNMTRDFSHAVIEAQVAYKDDYDEVVEVLREIVIQMRTEPRWQSEIHDDLEVMGLQRFADSAVVIKCRIRCGPFSRWAVMREFNRRMKMRFDEKGIEIPFPHQKMILEDMTVLRPTPPATRPVSLSPPTV